MNILDQFHKHLDGSLKGFKVFYQIESLKILLGECFCIDLVIQELLYYLLQDLDHLDTDHTSFHASPISQV